MVRYGTLITSSNAIGFKVATPPLLTFNGCISILEHSMKARVPKHINILLINADLKATHVQGQVAKVKDSVANG